MKLDARVLGRAVCIDEQPVDATVPIAPVEVHLAGEALDLVAAACLISGPRRELGRRGDDVVGLRHAAALHQKRAEPIPAVEREPRQNAMCRLAVDALRPLQRLVQTP